MASLKEDMCSNMKECMCCSEIQNSLGCRLYREVTYKNLYVLHEIQKSVFVNSEIGRSMCYSDSQNTKYQIGKCMWCCEIQNTK